MGLIRFELWLFDNQLSGKPIEDDVWSIAGFGKVVLLEPDSEGKVFGSDFSLNIPSSRGAKANRHNADYWVYPFGSRFYYTEINNVHRPSLKCFRDVGEIDSEFPSIDLPQLGVHGGFELMSGVGLYNSWVDRASFLKCTSLGICEKDTLGGTIAFQTACQKKGIKPILGMTVSVKWSALYSSEIKVYAKSEKGWQSLLRLNRCINVDLNSEVRKSDISLIRDCCIVLCSNTDLDLVDFEMLFSLSEHTTVYYQIDPARFNDSRADEQHLLYIQKYLMEWRGLVNPVLIGDAYFVNYGEHETRRVLGALSGRHRSNCDDYYLRSIDELWDRLKPLFADEKTAKTILDLAISKAVEIADSVNFVIETGKLHLPQYVLKQSDREKYSQTEGDNSDEQLRENKFLELIREGFRQKVPTDKSIRKVYIDRARMEVDLISRGGYQDYFLILEDIVSWCKQSGILSGIGRGSAGGSLVAYLLGITKVDPITYDLLFERFLNESRIKLSLPDIDTDFEGERRGEVKQYMESRYGVDKVCSVGTYQTYQVRALVQDFLRYGGVPAATRAFITQRIDQAEGEGSYDSIFTNASSKKALYDAIQRSAGVLDMSFPAANQPKSVGVHACATIIVPNKDENGNDKSIYEWLPVRMHDGILVSEWEGKWIESAGFLKEDILGVRQLDKFALIFKLVKQNEGTILDLESIPLDDDRVFEFFKKGFTEDCFHFGTSGLKGFSRELKPDSIHDLIAMIALHRPGAMKSGAHTEYVKCKFGEKKPVYDFGLREVTENTYGLYIYQEQVMKAVQVLGGFSLAEADGIRKAMGKKIKSKMDEYRQQFVDSAIQKGCPDREASQIWDKLEVFSGYGFNKSHAAAYAITGYISMWLKCHYPIEFWTASFEFGNESDIPNYVCEIGKIGTHVEIVPPDINVSGVGFESKDSRLFWSLSKVDMVGPVAAQAIIQERQNGAFTSLDQFMDRVPRKQVRSNCIENLIKSGAFDRVENVKSPKGRSWLLSRLKSARGGSIETPALNEDYDYVWILEQRQICGLGHIDYRKVIETRMSGWLKKKDLARVIEADQIFDERNVGKSVVVAGILLKSVVRKSKNGDFVVLTIDHNNTVFDAVIWNEAYEPNKMSLKSAENRIVVISFATIVEDSWRNTKAIHSKRDTTLTVL